MMAGYEITADREIEADLRQTQDELIEIRSQLRYRLGRESSLRYRTFVPTRPRRCTEVRNMCTYRVQVNQSSYGRTRPFAVDSPLSKAVTKVRPRAGHRANRQTLKPLLFRSERTPDATSWVS